MKEIFAVINQKGGVGKSTTAGALGAGLMQRGHAVLIIDLDAQGNLSYTMGAAPGAATSFDLLTGAAAADAVQHTPQGDIIPASPALAGADLAITQTGKEYRLKEALEPVRELYDFIVIDTPPALGILTINALTAATGAIIPAQADIYSLQGIGQLYSTIDAVRKYTNPQLQVKGILLTRFNARSVLSRDITTMIEDTAKQLGTTVFASRIREAIAVKEAQASKQGLLSYAPKSTAAQDYLQFVDEIERS